ncbi:hypothetical protein AB0I81_60375 [Nonomuraea sp. NPDC050404]|uniref:hypothetical protein n=1 Tax=Nonomuraea sp. NPDC050404 TaxID=3155783 RepID=UPI0033FF2B7B
MRYLTCRYLLASAGDLVLVDEAAEDGSAVGLMAGQVGWRWRLGFSLKTNNNPRQTPSPTGKKRQIAPSASVAARIRDISSRQERTMMDRIAGRVLVACSSAIGTHKHVPTFSGILNVTKFGRATQLNMARHDPA